MFSSRSSPVKLGKVIRVYPERNCFEVVLCIFIATVRLLYENYWHPWIAIGCLHPRKMKEILVAVYNFKLTLNRMDELYNEVGNYKEHPSKKADAHCVS